MSTDPELTRIVRSWLEDGVNVLPDRVLDDVLAELPVTPQRRVTWWPARRLIDMNSNLRLAGVAAAVLVIVVIAAIGLGLMRPQNVAGPGQSPSPNPTPTSLITPTPTATPEPTPAPVTLTTADVSTPSRGEPQSPGRYRVDTPFDLPFEITFVTDWVLTGLQPGMANVAKGYRPDAAFLNVLLIDDVYVDTCNPDAGTVGAPHTVDGLVDALTHVPLWEAGPVTDVQQGSYSGKHFVLTPPGAAYNDCNGGLPVLASFIGQPEPPGTNSTIIATMTVLDVDGTPVLIWQETSADTSAAAASEVDRTATSISFD